MNTVWAPEVGAEVICRSRQNICFRPGRSPRSIHFNKLPTSLTGVGGAIEILRIEPGTVQIHNRPPLGSLFKTCLPPMSPSLRTTPLLIRRVSPTVLSHTPTLARLAQRSVARSVATATGKLSAGPFTLAAAPDQ